MMRAAGTPGKSRRAFVVYIINIYIYIYIIYIDKHARAFVADGGAPIAVEYWCCVFIYIYIMRMYICNTLVRRFAAALAATGRAIRNV